MDRNCVNGCYVIFLVLGAISALLLTIAGAFEMPSHMLIWTAVWIVASLAISMAVPGGGGFALSEVFTLFLLFSMVELCGGCYHYETKSLFKRRKPYRLYCSVYGCRYTLVYRLYYTLQN
ncbi:MAG: hypothetical protein ACLRY7_01780 [Hominenteromicrobium sp.]|uniref:hypothetical protein n=1 Tax=Hominenteromicrobium sp. TaxID=3073581 RepID=UPI0039A37533